MFRKKLIRTCMVYKVQFFAVFFMMFIGVSVFVGLDSAWFGMEYFEDKYYEDTKLADAWINTMEVSENKFTQMEDEFGKENVSKRLYVNGVHANQTVDLLYIENKDDCDFRVESGEKFDTKKDGVWLFDEYAKLNNISIGDKFDIKFSGLTVSKKVLGLVKSSEYLYFPKSEDCCTPDYKNVAYAIIPSKFFNFGDKVPYNQILIHSSDDKQELYKKLNDIFDNQPYFLLSRDEKVSASMVKSKIDSTKVIANIFALAILLIAVLTIITTMNRINNKERVQIGILKALGFSNGKILFHYMSMGIVVSALGSIVGFILGPPLVGDIYLGSLIDYFDYPELGTRVRPLDFLIIVLLNLVLVVVLYFTCKRILRVKASDAINNCFETKVGKEKKTSKKRKKTLSFTVLWTIRDITRNKIRSMMTIFGVMGSLSLILCGFTMQDTMASLNEWTFADLHHYNSRISIEGSKISQIESLKKAVKGESSQSTLIELVRGEDFKTTNLIAYDVDKLIEFEDVKSNKVTLKDDKLYISKKLSDKYGIKEGDTLKWRIYGKDKYYEEKVYCIVNSPIEQGIFITQKYLDKFSMDYVPTTIYTNEKAADIKEEGCIKSITSVEDLKKQNNKALESFRMIISVMIIAAISLGLVVLYNLGMLSYNERFRELATLKVLGFSNKALNLLNVTQTLLLSLFGVIFGIPLARLFAEYMFNSIDSFPFKVTTTAISMGLSVGGVLLVILAVCIILSKRIKEVDMVVSLKMND